MDLEYLISLCADTGVNVVFIPFPLAGAYVEEIKTIVIDSQMTPCKQKCTLAHEYAHALRGHDGEQPTHIETKTDEAAAALLIPASSYECAERLYSTDVYLIAEELGVCVWVVLAYRRLLEKSRYK